MERTFYGKGESFLIKHTSGRTHLPFRLREQPRHSDPVLSCPRNTTAHCQVGDTSLWRCPQPAQNLLHTHSPSWDLEIAASPGINFVNGAWRGSPCCMLLVDTN